MKKIIATLSLLAFLAPVSFAVALDANRYTDPLRQGPNFLQIQQEMEKAKFKAVEAEASAAMQPGQAQTTKPAKAQAGVEVK
jgi:hypothetical protein